MNEPWWISGLTIEDAYGIRLDADPDVFLEWLKFLDVIGLSIRALLTGSVAWRPRS